MSTDSRLQLSVVVTVVSGVESLRRCLTSLEQQVRRADGELIVPFDRWSREIEVLANEFPNVQFHFTDGSGLDNPESISVHDHRLFDRRRSAGLRIARGRIVAITEDHATPAPDWCEQMLIAHRQPFAAIGGSIENEVDRPMNWALYYCDFGRYGQPRSAGPRRDVSDVNVSYKSEALQAIRSVWYDAYQEPAVHSALRSLGDIVFFDPRPVVFENRPELSFADALRERVHWGRTFGEIRARSVSRARRVVLAIGEPVLPLILSLRVLRHMLRQRRSFRQVALAMPIACLLSVGWSFGEFVGNLMVGRSRGSLDDAATAAVETTRMI